LCTLGDGAHTNTAGAKKRLKDISTSETKAAVVQNTHLWVPGQVVGTFKPELIQEFIELYTKEYGEALDPDEANLMVLKLFELYRPFYEWHHEHCKGECMGPEQVP
jgi:hypothetical protein